MPAIVTYPFHVKYMGRFYAPYEKITVEDAQDAVRQGAKIVEIVAVAVPPEAPKAPKTAKVPKVSETPKKSKGGRPRKNP
nr:MAG TPA: hypothetical protein [Caudoviricetes sp.]